MSDVAGNYTLVVKNAHNCAVTSNFALTNPTPVSISVTGSTVDCGGGTGSISVSASGGTPETYGYNFTCNSLTGTGNSYTFPNLSDGSYSLTVKDKNNCSASTSSSIISKQITFNTTVSSYTDGYNITCEHNGQIDFSSIVNANNYSFTAQYNQSGVVGASISFPNITDAGTSSIQFTNTDGCSANWSSSLTKAPELTAMNINLTPASGDYDIHCNEDAQLTFTTNQASSFYRTVDWKLNGSSISNDITINASDAGTYLATVITKYGCSMNKSVVLDKSPELLGLNINIAGNSDFDIYCDNPAILTPAFSGTHSISSYNWKLNSTTVGTNSTYNATLAGVYSVILTDNYGCSASATTPNLTKPNDFSSINVVKTVLPNGNYDIYCNQNGRLTVNTSGGESNNDPIYYYTLSGNTSSRTLNYLDVSSAGSYDIQVVDKYGCSISQNEINITKSPDFTFLNLNISSAGADFDIYCNQNTSISPSYNSGHTIDSYNWTLPGGSHLYNSNLNVTNAGIYSLLLTDNYGCYISKSTTTLTKAPEISLLLITADEISDGYEISCGQNSNAYINNISWFETASTYNISSYLWSNSSSATTLNTNIVGNYYLSVTDEHGCTALSNTITLDKVPLFDVNMTSSTVGTGGYNITCDNDGSIGLNYSGAGAANVKTNIEWKFFNNILSENSENLNNISNEGWYFVDVTDKYGCSSNDSILITHSLAPDISIDVTRYAQSLTGDITVNISNGTPAYTITLDKIDEPTSSVSGTQTVFTGLVQGMYKVTVDDINGCSDIEMVNIYSNIQEFTLNATINDVTCKGSQTGSFVSSISGGTAPYRYKLYKNSNLVDEQTNLSSFNITNLANGDYSLEIWDANNNPYDDANYGYLYEFTISEPSEMLNISAVVNNVLIFGQNTGTINLNANGGWGNYSYSTNGSNYTSTSSFSELLANDYTVYVLDDNGCIVTKEITVSQSDELILTYEMTPTNCNGDSDGSILVSATGGIGSYQYSFNNSSFSTSSFFNNLNADTYKLIAKDEVGAYDTVYIEVTEPDVIQINSFDVVAANCVGECGNNIGSANVNVSGGTSPYSYQWDDDCGHTSQTASTLPSGIINVIVTDKNGCQINEQTIVPSLNAPNINITTVDVLCNGQNTGSATLNVSAGNPPYVFNWGTIDNHTTNQATDLIAGNYNVVITDASGCSAIANFDINQSQAINITYQLQQPSCYDYKNGEITAVVSGGTQPYNVSWNLDTTIVNSNTISNLNTGYYKINVQDANSCPFNDSVLLSQPDEIDLGLLDFMAICQNSNVILSPTGTYEDYDWISTNGFSSTESEVNVSDAGTYYLTVVNQNGCSASDSTVITISNDLLTANFLMISEANINDTVVIIEISTPKPDRIEWTLPDSFSDIFNENEIKFIVPSEVGLFNVHLNAFLGGCYDAIDKTITIYGDEEPKVEVFVPSPKVIETVNIYPNPSNGEFFVDVDLSDKMPIIVEVYDMQQYSKLLSIESNGQDFYNFYISLGSIYSGVYVLKIITKDDIKTQKFIINR